MKQYANYHKHDDVSNIFVPDVKVNTKDYIDRIKELGYDYYFTTNHGTGGDIFDSRRICDDNQLHCIFGIEAYIVPDPLLQDKSSYHIIIIPKTNKARKKLNLITSKSNETGFYYRPRISPTDLLELDKDDIFITTACMAGIIRDERGVREIFTPLVSYFEDNLFLEIQNHKSEEQIIINNRCKELRNKYGCKLIAANDSHYIYPEQSTDRDNYLKGKGITYSTENQYILDYPDYDTFFTRFEKQGLFKDAEIEEAIDNTRLFESCEEIYLDKEIKMPDIYKNLSYDEKIDLLRNKLNIGFKQIVKEENLNKEEQDIRIAEVKKELQTIIDTKEVQTQDYFLLNEALTKKAINDYGGILTRTGRGSCGCFYINKVLGITQIDLCNSPIKLYSERFISTARLLENHAMPDIDFNVATQEPFVKAAKDLLGEHRVYPMIEYKTMNINSAFKIVCKIYNVPFSEANEIAKDLDSYAEDAKWKPYITEAQRYINYITTASVHACAFALSNYDIREEYGIVKVGDVLCAMVTSEEADFYKILKDDFLIVSVWELISDTFKLIDKPILSIKELLSSVDSKVWDLYAKGITCSLNQMDTQYATNLARRYKPQNVGELAMLVAAIRPSFDPWREGFIKRETYTTGSAKLDTVLSETSGRILFQETLMRYFEWLNISPSTSIGLIKKISKKKIKPEDFEVLEKNLRESWIKQTSSIDYFQETWDMIQSCMSYGFAAPHALATAIDSLYCAWLKVNYPLQYYTVTLQKYSDDSDKTSKLTDELKYFHIKLENIKFRHSLTNYAMDIESNTIYKSLKSIKYLSKKATGILEELKDSQFDSFCEFLLRFTASEKELNILIHLDFFSEFGKPKELLRIVSLFNILYSSQKKELKDKISKDAINENPVFENIVKNNAANETKCQYRGLNTLKILKESEQYIKQLNIPDFTLLENMNFQMEHLGYLQATYKEEDRVLLYINAFKVLKTKATNKKFGYAIETISIGSGKVGRFTIFCHEYNKYGAIQQGDLIKLLDYYPDRGYFILSKYDIVGKKNFNLTENENYKKEEET